MARLARLACLLAVAGAPLYTAEALAQPEPSGVPSNAEATEAAVQAELAQFADERQSFGGDDGPSLKFYGFADMLVMKAFPKRRLGAFPPKGVTFAVGNINLYATADLTHGFSSLLEVRFSYLPNGAFDQNTLAVTSTTVFDYADWNRPTRWGGIVLERIHLDYRWSSLFTIRAGQWLTPYGIWNVDHGSPTIIAIGKPYVIGEQLFPTRQTGFQAFGGILLGEWTLAYDVTVSNGRGDIDQLDMDTNKAAGGHLSAASAAIGSFCAGRPTHAEEHPFASVSVSVPDLREGDTGTSYEAEGRHSLGVNWIWPVLHSQTRIAWSAA